MWRGKWTGLRRNFGKHDAATELALLCLLGERSGEWNAACAALRLWRHCGIRSRARAGGRMRVSPNWQARLPWRSWMMIAWISIVLVVGTKSCAQELSQDTRALLDFKDALDDATGLEDWNVNETDPSDTASVPCGWTGVSCDNVSLIVISLSLMGMGLRGTISPSIGRLTNLKELDLSSNNFTGAIPGAVGNLSAIQALNLSSNQLSGCLPGSLSQLSNLVTVDVNGNFLNGTLPVYFANFTALQRLLTYDNFFEGSIPWEYGRLSNLLEFRTGGNRLSGMLPGSLGNCSSLVVFGIAFNPLTGSFPSDLGQLENLVSLNLVGSLMTGPMPPEYGNLTSLRTMALYKSYVTGSIPPELGKLQNLQFLWLYLNNLTGSIPPELGNCSSLSSFDFSYNRLTGSIPAELGMLQRLSVINIFVNNLSGPIPPELGNAGNLTILEFYENQLEGPIPSELGRLTKLSVLAVWLNRLSGGIPVELGNCSNLLVLDLSLNMLSGPIPPQIFTSGSLQRLFLFSNALSGAVPPEINLAHNLTRVRLGQNTLNGSIPRELAQLPNLVYLDLHSNNLTGSLPLDFVESPSLQALIVSDNALYGNLPESLGNVSSLVQLDLSMNLLSGPLPPAVGNLDRLITLNLSQNHLTGEIPPEIGNCQSLNELDLGGNDLIGTIPAEIGKLISLEISLNLSWNNMSGPLPATLGSLTKLSKLDLSHNSFSGGIMKLNDLVSLTYVNISNNMFSGPLPDIFSRPMMSSSYFGNPGLCSTIGPTGLCYNGQSRAPHHSKHLSAAQKAAIWTVLGSLFVAAGVILLVGVTWYVRQYDKTCQHYVDPATSSQWTLVPFQKLEVSIEEILFCLEEVNVIGRGGSGTVYKASLQGGQAIAVKKLWMPGKGEMSHDAFTAEVEILGNIRHGNILRLLGSLCNSNTKLLLYDFMPNGSLGELLHGIDETALLDWGSRYKIALGAAYGLAYLHHDCVPHILHRDVKSNNILVDSRYEANVADFGLAKLIYAAEDHASMSRVVGSYGYIAPEYAYTTKVTEKSDVFSFGVVLLEIVTGRKPVDSAFSDVSGNLVGWIHHLVKTGKCDRSIFDPRLGKVGDASLCEMEEMLGIALLCIATNPIERPTMREVVAMLLEIQQDRSNSWTKSKSITTSSSSKEPILPKSPDSEDSSWSRT